LNDRVKAVNDESFADVADLSEKMRKLQKHQAFEAELKANADKIADIIRVDNSPLLPALAFCLVRNAVECNQLRMFRMERL
jgi:hypothetical protein